MFRPRYALRPINCLKRGFLSRIETIQKANEILVLRTLLRLTLHVGLKPEKILFRPGRQPNQFRTLGHEPLVKGFVVSHDSRPPDRLVLAGALCARPFYPREVFASLQHSSISLQHASIAALRTAAFFSLMECLPRTIVSSTAC